MDRGRLEEGPVPKRLIEPTKDNGRVGIAWKAKETQPHATAYDDKKCAGHPDCQEKPLYQAYDIYEKKAKAFCRLHRDLAVRLTTIHSRHKHEALNQLIEAKQKSLRENERKGWRNYKYAAKG